MIITIQLLGRPRITRGAAAVGLPGLGADLLDGMTVKGAAAFETWLLAQQRHAAAASEASRSGMRELTLRSLRYGAALGREGDGAAADVLADELAEYR